MLASELSQSCGYPVLFIPLHQFDLTADLRSAVQGFIGNSRYLEGNPLDASNGEDRLLIIFDGLDELAEQGKNAAEIAKNFVEWVIRDITHHNAQGRKRQVLITGRDLAVQSSLSSFRGPKQVYHLLPYYVREKLSDKNNLLKTDLRDIWWQRYGVANGKLYPAMPKQLKFEKLDEITSQPLLNYLVALSFEEGKLEFNEQTNLNKIYQDLLSAVYKRQYDSSGVHKSAKGMEEPKFFRVLEEIALAIWHGDGRTATVDYIQKRCEESNLSSYMKVFEQSAESGVTRLLTAFYFRQCTDLHQGDKTFEFTHKSFGEYLTARRLVRMLKRVCDMLQRRDDDPDEGWNEREALLHWAEICGSTTMDEYLVEFVQNEIALQNKEDWSHWQHWLCRLIESSLKSGLPMEKLGLSNFAQMQTQAQARNADECLLVMLNACARLTEQVSEIHWPSRITFGQWLRKLNRQTNDPTASLAIRSLNFLDLKNLELHVQEFWGANLSCSVIGRSGLNYANLTYANLTSADFVESTLGYACLEGANLTGANLSRANLKGANLKGANLTGVNLTDANLTHANLTVANLTGAIYHENQLSEEQKKQAMHLNPANHSS
jgi:uncharacterized protein YjbI with pentapeptide repeats